jgi:hypothetical protein
VQVPLKEKMMRMKLMHHMHLHMMCCCQLMASAIDPLVGCCVPLLYAVEVSLQAQLHHSEVEGWW